ncbi:hypothetical protein CVIRNUC_002242 [Coccomyxa viridis]|uniref:non-specific serine/threonine protein kinase n=1 Tax=Coccomyxa viridis TaxID=1274662 RepID=A0AAV1HY88_9CHLO|nr:hypothetical protein CVIRNUC_002242 [Coccomyxa viridis]
MGTPTNVLANFRDQDQVEYEGEEEEEETTEDEEEEVVEQEVELPPVPAEVHHSSMPIYKVGKRLGKGGFGQVFLAARMKQRKVTPVNKPNQVAIKFEHVSSKGCLTNGKPAEWSVYSAIGSCPGMPKVYARTTQASFHILIMELLGPSLWDLCKEKEPILSVEFVAYIAIEALQILEGLHVKGYVHGDIKPENFLMGHPDSPNAKELYLVDLGLSRRYKAPNGEHFPYRQIPTDFRGTVRYASTHAHLGRSASRRDDMESLAYTLIFLLRGRLPWQGFEGRDKGFRVCKTKMDHTAKQLCPQSWPSAFRRFLEVSQALRYEEEPYYAACMRLFVPLLGSHVPREITGADASPVPAKITGKKRDRASSEESSDDELVAPELLDPLAGVQQRKKARLGFRGCQWIAVFGERNPMKQRYHYNVSVDRLEAHVQKGWDQDLCISSATSNQNLWALVMDEATGYSQQAYTVSREFLPRSWCMAQWSAGYYITAVAGADNGRCLAVVSKGTRWQQQSYKVDDKFPYDWVKRKWAEKFAVTSIATTMKGGKPQWAVIMSRGSKYTKQVIEVDFQYPSEGIHYHWDRGFRISCVGASRDQTVVVLSMERGPGREDVTQETLRTSDFPHVKEKWGKDLYLESMAFGRTTT